ncbi:MAG: hypothetical protein BMS9Abin15_0224 [Gammaproteobacteria bacterium]|nr:MAG: hypothetical protein BMS9Abin15_0224 [Gammaproteobacteria bacterium]
MSNYWVVAADSSRARIFSAETAKGKLVEVETLAHPEARLHGQDVTSDAPGTSLSSKGGGRHGVGGEHDLREQDDIRFAKRVCDTLKSADNRGRFGKLYILAPPAFLGILRERLSGAIRSKIAGEINKNVAVHSLDDIRSHLPEYL